MHSVGLPHNFIAFESEEEANSVMEYLRTCSEVCRKNTPMYIGNEERKVQCQNQKDKLRPR